MTAKEMIDYLNTFDGETDVCILVINPPERIRHEVQKMICITDAGRPLIGIEVGGGSPLMRK